MKCCICENEIDVQGTWKGGHNAEPVKAGRCCTDCNNIRVIPERIMRMLQAQRKIANKITG